MGKAYRIPSETDRLRKQQIQIRNLQALNRNRNTPRPVASTAFAGASAGGSSGGTGNFLATKGDTMTGPFALGPPVDFSIEIDANGVINIGESSSNSQYSSNLQLEDIQPNTFTLDTIAGAAFDGQILILRTFAPSSTFTIAAGTVGNDGNIQTPDSNDVTGVGDLQMIVFVFDEALVINNNTGGTWRLLNTFGTGGGSGTPPFQYGLTLIATTTGNAVLDLNPGSAAKGQHFIFSNELTGDVDITFSSTPASGFSQPYIIEYELGATVFNVTFNGVTDVTPIAGTANSKTKLAGFITNNAGLISSTFTMTSTAGSGGGSGFATTALNNLVSPVLNVGIDINSQTLSKMGDITYDATGFDIADTTNPVDNFFVEQVRFQSGTIVANVPMITSVGGNSMDINHPTGSGINFSENGATAAVIIDGGGLITSNNLILQNILTLNDNVGDPASNGQFARNSTDVKVFSGGAVRNLSNIGAGSPLTTKGDLFGFSTVDARIPVGTNGQVLTANSAVALGVEWSTAAGGGATIELDNLGTTAINANLFFGTTGLDIGDTTNPVDQLFFGTGRLQTNLLTANVPSFTSLTGNTFDVNFPSGSTFNIFENGVSKHTFSASSLTSPNIIVSNTLTINDSTTSPGANGQFSRNGTILGVQIPEFEIRNATSVTAELAELSLTKVDAAPQNGDSVAVINFQTNDTGVVVKYASIEATIGDVTDWGALAFNVRADNGLVSAVIIQGDDNNQRFQMLMSGTTQARIQPLFDRMAYFLTPKPTDFSFNIGTAGSLEIPQINDGSPSLNDLNAAGGAFDGMIVHDISDGRIYVRNSSTAWDFYNRDGQIT